MEQSLTPGLYIHIPFCARKCAYCDFLSFAPDGCRAAAGEDYERLYFDALINEIEVLGRSSTVPGVPGNVSCDGAFDTVYIGGGTPGLTDADNIARLLAAVRDSFTLAPDAELTLETNPVTLTEAKAQAYRASGINRLSLGVQSLSEPLLSFLGRIHDAETARNSVRLAQKYFDNFNTDFIFGVPGLRGVSAPQSLEDVRECLRFVTELRVPHVSFYGLIKEPGTRLAALDAAGRLDEVEDDAERQMYALIRSTLISRNGYSQYEISNFALTGRESRHNLKYWSGAPYLGVGLGAVSYLKRGDGSYVRFRNTVDLEQYISCGGSMPEREVQEVLDVPARKKEFMLLGFRKLAGPDPEMYRRLFDGAAPEAEFAPELEELMRDGLIDPALKLTDKGLDFANLIFMKFV